MSESEDMQKQQGGTNVHNKIMKSTTKGEKTNSYGIHNKLDEEELDTITKNKCNNKLQVEKDIIDEGNKTIQHQEEKYIIDEGNKTIKHQEGKDITDEGNKTIKHQEGKDIIDEGNKTIKHHEGKDITDEGNKTIKNQEGTDIIDEGNKTIKHQEGKDIIDRGHKTIKDIIDESNKTIKHQEGKYIIDEGNKTIKHQEGKDITDEGNKTIKHQEGKDITDEGNKTIKNQEGKDIIDEGNKIIKHQKGKDIIDRGHKTNKDIIDEGNKTIKHQERKDSTGGGNNEVSNNIKLLEGKARTENSKNTINLEETDTIRDYCNNSINMQENCEKAAEDSNNNSNNLHLEADKSDECREKNFSLQEETDKSDEDSQYNISLQEETDKSDENNPNNISLQEETDKSDEDSHNISLQEETDKSATAKSNNMTAVINTEIYEKISREDENETAVSQNENSTNVDLKTGTELEASNHEMTSDLAVFSTEDMCQNDMKPSQFQTIAQKGQLLNITLNRIGNKAQNIYIIFYPIKVSGRVDRLHQGQRVVERHDRLRYWARHLMMMMMMVMIFSLLQHMCAAIITYNNKIMYICDFKSKTRFKQFSYLLSHKESKMFNNLYTNLNQSWMFDNLYTNLNQSYMKPASRTWFVYMIPSQQIALQQRLGIRERDMFLNDMNRLATFVRYPQSAKKYPIVLARSGFEYIGDGNNDRVKCVFCGVIKDNWSADDNVEQMHYTACQMVNMTEERSSGRSIDTLSGIWRPCFNMSQSDQYQRGITDRQSHSSYVSEKLDTSAATSTNHLDQSTNFCGEKEILDSDSSLIANKNTQNNNIGEELSASGNIGYHHVSSCCINKGVTIESHQRFSNISAEESNDFPKNQFSRTSRNNILFPTDHFRNDNLNPTGAHVLQQTLDTGQQENVRPSNILAQSQRSTGNQASPSTITHHEPVRTDHIFPGKAKYMEYAMLKKRTASFENSPDILPPMKETLAKAGFFCTGGKYNYCCCFFCGKEWQGEDDPFVEHAQWSENCSFIRHYLKQIQYKETEEHAESRGRVVRNPSVTENAVTASLIDSGLPEQGVHEAARQLRQTGTNLSAYNVLKTMKPETDTTDGGTSTADTDTSRISILQSENSTLMEDFKCKICMIREWSVVFLPCADIVSCAACAELFEICPACSQNIDQTVTVKLSHNPLPGMF